MGHNGQQFFITNLHMGDWEEIFLFLRARVNPMNKLTQQVTSAHGEVGRKWLIDLPRIIQTLASQWNLQDLKPYQNLSWNYVAHGTQKGHEVVLKLCCTLQPLSHEVHALRTFQAGSCVEVIQFDEGLKAGLLEAAIPGADVMKHKDTFPMESVAICCEMAQKLSLNQRNTQFRFEKITDLSSCLDKDWPLPLEMLVAARKLRREYPKSHETYVIHGDLHRENILSRGNEWRAIDPKEQS